jgi:hypothetical protein
VRHLAALAALVALVALAIGCSGPAPTPKKKAIAPAPRPAAAPVERPPVKPERPDDEARLAAAPSSTARPGSMVAQITAADVDGLVGALRGYLSATNDPDLAGLDPEIRTLVRELAGSKQLELAWSEPIAAFVLASGGDPSFVVASYGPTRPTNVDPQVRLHRQGDVWLVGEVDAIDAVRGYATTLAIKAGPVELAVFPDAVWAGYADQITGMVQLVGAGVAGAKRGASVVRLANGLVRIFREARRAVVTLDVSGATCELGFALEARPDTDLARFGAGQKPADHGLLEQLPAGAWTAVASGRLHFDEDLARLFTDLSLLDMATDSDDEADVDELARQLWDIFAGRSGRFAWAGILARGGSELSQLIELRDVAGASALIDSFPSLTQPGWDASKKLVRKIERPRRIAGVKVRAMTVRTADKAARPWWFRYGLVDGYVFGASGKRSNRWVRELIQAARRAARKKPGPRHKLPAGLTAALADSKMRRENMMVWLDVAGIGAYVGASLPPATLRASRDSGLVIGAALTAKASGFRVSVPADQLGVMTALDP